MYDICVIGAGWAGFNAAIRAKELGADRVMLVEQDKLGGTCLNYGCIPTKVLVNSANIFSELKKSADFGVDCNNLSFEFSRITKRKKDVVLRLNNGMQFILKNKGIEFINGRAQFISEHRLIIDDKNIDADYMIIATGSYPVELPQLKFDGRRILSSNDILELDNLPQSLLIVGAGVIGCEFASIFSQLGTKVTLLELMDRILPQEDKDISLKLTVIFKKSGVEVITGRSVQEIPTDKFDKILVCVGRKPNTANLDLKRIGIEEEKGRIKTDDFLRTNIKNIYAAGDCTTKLMLAHIASMEGRFASENIFLKPKHPDYRAIPNCIFTNPTIASCGVGEDKAGEQDEPIMIGKFDFLGLGMAHILGRTEGFVKLIFSKKTKEIIGASILGEEATELISCLSIAINQKLTISELQGTVFGHPTLSESIWEAVNNIKSDT